jgi:ketosteroid isomerase-like protein
MKKIAFLTLAAAIILAACQPKPAAVDLKAEADSVRALEDQWTAANQMKNIDKVVVLLSTEFVGMPPNSSRMIGIDSLRKSMVTFFADSTLLWESYKFTCDKIEVATSGDLAYVYGTQTMTVKTPKGPVEDVGKGVDIWKKENGKWKAVLSIWNSDKPIEGQ